MVIAVAAAAIVAAHRAVARVVPEDPAIAWADVRAELSRPANCSFKFYFGWGLSAPTFLYALFFGKGHLESFEKAVSPQKTGRLTALILL